MKRAEAVAVLEGDRETAIALLVRVGELIETNRRLEARVAELERRLNRHSRNSSLPPSQDPPSAAARPRKPGSGRSRGGQPGHEGRYRRLLSFERVGEVVDHWPECCARCCHRFGEVERLEVSSPQRHQVGELPPISVRVTEHRLHRLRCPACGRETRAGLPAEVPRSACGPRLQAAVATLAVRNRVSRRDTVELIDELFGCRLATGTIDAILQRAGEALAELHALLADQIRFAPAVNIDETGWRLRGGKRTLWGVLTERAALFRIAPDRHEREAKALLGDDFAGIVCSDRWWAYDYLDPERRQLWWAHLAPLKQELRVLLEQAARKSAKTKYHRLFAKNLLKRWPALWTFTLVEGVEPTNNHAERGLRGAVIYRKLSLGSQSERGERTIERLLSASVTCRLQRRSLFAYLTDVLTASIRGDPIPALT